MQFVEQSMKMTMAVDVNKLQSLLQELPGSMGRAVSKRAMMNGAKVLRDHAKQIVVRPRGKGRKKSALPPGERANAAEGTWSTGRLRRALTAKTFPIRDISKALRGRRGSSTVGYYSAVYVDNKKLKGRNARRYAHLVEYGTAPHAIGKGSRTKKRGRREVSQVGGLHPGAKARPFMRPTLDTKHDEAIAAIAAEAKSELKVQAKRLQLKYKGVKMSAAAIRNQSTGGSP